MLRRSAPIVVAIVLVVVGLFSPTSARPVAAATLPSGFSDNLVANVGAPTDVAITPGGFIYITTQGGQVRRHATGTTTTLSLDLTAKVCADSERGLLGIALDPAYATNRFVYLYYTFRKFGVCDTNTATAPVNRVSRFKANLSFILDPASEVVLLDNIPSPAGNHNGGDLNVGSDGLLYMAVGDGGCKLDDPSRCADQNDNATFLTNLAGKILRIALDGSIPADNPWASATDARRCGDPAGPTAGDGPCSEIFAYGLRNPFRFAFKPGTSEFHINDVGQGSWEEIDRGIAGANYGWNVREGHCATGSTTDCASPPAGMTNPIFDYAHADGCASITGGAFVPPSVWPAEFAGAYLYADYVCGKIVRLNETQPSTWVPTDFVTGLGGSSAVSMIFGPSVIGQSLYYTTYAAGGQLRRIDYVPANNPPTAVLSVAPLNGVPPLEVTFDAGNSGDPDDDPIEYQFDFGDGSGLQTGSPVVTHSYANPGTYTASLVVSDDRGGVSNPVTATIQVGGPPEPVIDSPTISTLFAVGQQITLHGIATDPDEGNLGDDALSWTVVLHHGSHTHPFLGPVSGNDIAFTAPAPEDLAAAANSYLEILLTATDSTGASTTISQLLQPRMVALTFTTDPSGLNVTVNGQPIVGPTTLTSWEGWQLNVNAPNQAYGDRNYRFRDWSDGGSQAHAIVTPGLPTTYTAEFKRTGKVH